MTERCAEKKQIAKTKVGFSEVVTITGWNNQVVLDLLQRQSVSDEGCFPVSLFVMSAALHPQYPLPHSDHLWDNMRRMFDDYMERDRLIVTYEMFAQAVYDFYPAWGMPLSEYRLNKDGEKLFGKSMNKLFGVQQGPVDYESLPRDYYTYPFGMFLHQAGGSYGHCLTHDGSREAQKQLKDWLKDDYRIVALLKFSRL